MSKPFRKPARADVERIIREEAKAARLAFQTVLNPNMRRRAVAARRNAIRRIVEETGCSERGLSLVWGVETRTVRAALSARSPRHEVYDRFTIDHLAWRYSEVRAAQIVAGHDPSTQSDLASWRRLCAKANP